MPSNLSQNSNKARAMKVTRLNETFPQTELRRLEQAELTGLLRHQNSPNLGVFSWRLTWRLKETETVEAAESCRHAVSDV
ncbi:hypothetical protein TNCT_598471 [Trichonephila clavata]|uniref:Uncharacterized protein n=1 Tax=Trichonephila clavata TaxID=2740835 RepID=A0A8X6JBC3_TRICU|nr:hypothetical protein TNCT_598471 [Trichonephila clavata]